MHVCAFCSVPFSHPPRALRDEWHVLAVVRCKWTVGLTREEEEGGGAAEEETGKKLRFQLEGT